MSARNRIATAPTTLSIVAYMLSCKARDQMRRETLRRLRDTDWEAQVTVVLDQSRSENSQERQQETSRHLLTRAARDGGAFVLFLEDDLAFNRHLRHNLDSWSPVRHCGPSGYLLASLYNPGLSLTESLYDRRTASAHRMTVIGSQALLMSSATVRYVLDRWDGSCDVVVGA